MTYKNVLEEWTKHKPQGRQNGKTFFSMVASALEKQIPKKPILRYFEDYKDTIAYCPLCGHSFGEIKPQKCIEIRVIESARTFNSKQTHCISCGQAIDFGGAMRMSCKNCKYFHRLKDLHNGTWEVKSVCTVFPQTEKGYDAFALIVKEDDGMCEMFEEAENEA